ncbi:MULTISPECIES: hypothetical protein [Rheinheimera]|uniref:hypothetical protein n=1 Tax=Rheinheimera TaxID=67575 RepID=UPI0010512C62|nr:hypothetical protein [Rheinheimera sp. D18]QBL08627.1 hypothetical protein E0Z06_03415 [Rheinheimera sp. D18]
MNETYRLEKIRNLGVRLQELELVSIAPGKSYASTALNFLFADHELERPCGLPLEHSLKTLGQAIMAKRKVRFSSLDADAVIDFFCRLYRVH